MIGSLKNSHTHSIMEPPIVDYYNDLPQMVHVIDKLNEEYETAMETIRELQQENQRLKTRYVPPEIPWENKEAIRSFTRKVNAVCRTEPESAGGFVPDPDDLPHDKIAGEYNFMCWCAENPDDVDGASFPVGKGANGSGYYKNNSVIKEIIKYLDDLTNNENPEWCELKVVASLESLGFTEQIDGYYESSVQEFIDILLSPETPSLSVAIQQRSVTAKAKISILNIHKGLISQGF